MKVTQSEPELISAIARRDAAGAAVLYDQYAAKLFEIIYCQAPGREIAEAILEETLMYVWFNYKECLEQDKRLLLWMAGVARQLAKKVQCRYKLI